jgi:transposase-like protein
LGHPRRQVELAIPKLRSGLYFPEWLLERQRRAEQALASVVATSYLSSSEAARNDATHLGSLRFYSLPF